MICEKNITGHNADDTNFRNIVASMWPPKGLLMTTDTASSTPDIAAPQDATEVYGWAQGVRTFDGTVRESGGVTVRIAGVQRANRTCERYATLHVRPGFDEAVFEPMALRQLAAVLVAAADEIEGRR